MLLATGQFTSKFFMNIKKPQKTQPTDSLSWTRVQSRKELTGFFFSPLKKSVPWIGSWWKVLYRNTAENDRRGDVVHILTHMRSNHWLASGEFILTVYFQDSHQYNVWELNPSPTKSVPRLPLASTVQLWSLHIQCLQNEQLLTQEKSQTESIQV